MRGFSFSGASPARGTRRAEGSTSISLVRRNRLLPGIFVLVTFAAAIAGVTTSLAHPGTFAGIGLLIVAVVAAIAGWLALGAPVNRRAMRP